MGDLQEALGGYEFDCNQVEPAKPREPIPADWYPMMVDELEIKPTKQGDGKYLKLKLKVVSGKHEGSVVFHNVNLKNPSAKAVEIGLRELSAIGHAVGELNLKHTDQLKDKVLMVKVALVNSEKYGPQNEAKGFKSTVGVSAGASTSQPPELQMRAATPPAADESVPPWLRK